MTVFKDYLNKISATLQNRYHVSEDMINERMEFIFDAYINSIPLKECVKNFLKNVLAESKNENKFEKYKKEVIKLIEKCGYKNIDKYKFINETINDYYNTDTDTYSCSSDCISQLKNNKIDIRHTINPNKYAQDIENKLRYILHNANLDNFYLIKTKVYPTSVSLICNIKLFENIKDIDTSINAYCKEIDKQLKPFIRLYVDAGSKISIQGYQLDENNLYCRVAINIDITKSDGFDDKKLDIKEIARIVKFYISVFDTFTTQNSQLYNAEQKTGF